MGPPVEFVEFVQNEKSFTVPAAGSASGDLGLIHMEKLVNEMVQATGYKVGDLVDLARHHHLFEWIIGTADDPSWDRNDRSVWGRLLARFEKKVFSNKMRFVLLSSLWGGVLVETLP